ncbi:MAG: M23 family metallopeptidase [Actinobacteria bacterium]|nr:M23 family metallopeptidase [Actinomycetota bacterium]
MKKVFSFILVLSLLLAVHPGLLYPGDSGSISGKEYLKRPFIIPLDGKIITSFRETYFDYKKNIFRKHTGIDIEGHPGQKVKASGNGVVSYTGFSPTGGRTVVIKHNEKIRTTYLNLSSIYVSRGEPVRQGEVIASIGAKDDPSNESSHLHFGVIYIDNYLDPEQLLKIDYGSISRFLKLKYIQHDFSIN